VRSVRFEKTLGKFGKELLPNIAAVQDFDCGDFLVQNINYQHSFVRVQRYTSVTGAVANFWQGTLTLACFVQ
jgi:hypothetical protein